jgi:CDP-glycerol glycerophosphotransferase (TagB/SpsB family)
MRPDLVLVRASYSTQIHFPVLCYVARALGIPSLEIQHGILYLGQSTFVSRPAVQYVATYGPLTSNALKKFGYTDKTLFNVGSPRFDVYRAMREKKVSAIAPAKPFTIACIVPAILPQSWSDSYEVAEYFSIIAAATAHIPNALVLLKIRPDPDNENFYRSAVAHAFGPAPYRIAQYEPLVDVFAESDAIVSIYSTTVLEALISGRPVVYNGIPEMQKKALDEELSDHAAAGALIAALTPQELAQSLELLAREPERRAALVAKADDFMERNYSFDGHASQKLASVIRTLVTYT